MKFLRILQAVLREIFEESAYERFCSRQGLARDRESYRVFLVDNESAKARRVKCC